MAYKSCPKCSVECGPRTKVCVCGHVYIKDSSHDEDNSDSFDGPVNVQPQSAICISCGVKYYSYDYKIDEYGNVTHLFQDECYCGPNCLKAHSDLKDELLEGILLNSEFQEYVETKSQNFYYKQIFDYIANRKVKEKKLSEYLDNHPKITFTTNPKKRILTVRDCEEVGVRVPPKIGEHVGAEPEAPQLSKLDRLLFKKEKVDFSEDEEFEEEIEETELEDGEDFGDVKEEKPNPLAKMLGFSSSQPVSVKPAPINTPVIAVPGNVDMTTMPRQGQKKCGWKNKVYSGKGCGTIVGVRTGNCPKCNYQF